MAPSTSTERSEDKSGFSEATQAMVYILYFLINSVAFFIRVDLALVMVVPSTFMLYAEGLVNLAVLLFMLINVPALLSLMDHLHEEILFIMAIHAVFYYILATTMRSRRKSQRPNSR